MNFLQNDHYEGNLGVKKEDGINFVCERFVPLLLPCEEKTTEKAELLFQVLYQCVSSEINHKY